MAEKDDRDLAVAALGVFDGLSNRTLVGIRKGSHRSGKVSVWPSDLTRLLQAIDNAYPGVVDRFVQSHKELEAQRRLHE